MVHFYNKLFKWIIFISEASTVCADTNRCARQYQCDISLNITTLISDKNTIKFYISIVSPYHRMNLIDGINASVKLYIKENIVY